ncbi:MAG: hypothetical protein ACTMIR_11090 [Cellulomonadaceae bacterium]
MRRMTPMAVLAAASALSMIILAGCTGQDSAVDTTPSAESTPALGPSGEAIQIGAPHEAGDTEPHSTDGVTVDLPAGAEIDRQESGTIAQTVVTLPGDGQERVAVTVDTQPSTDANVDISAQAGFAQLGASGVRDLEFRPADWSTWPYSVAVTGTMDDPTSGGTSEVLLVTTRTADGSATVTVSAQAPSGTLEDSAAMAALRTMRPAS